MSAATRDGSARSGVFVAVVLCIMYILCSASLIHFNKFVLQRFPYPWELTALHMTTSWLFSMVLYAIAPSMFPGMVTVRDRKLEVLRLFVPLGVCFAIALYASNKAYLYSSVAFLQFMKEANVILVFLFCCFAGLQTVDRVKAFIVMWVLIGASTCVHGEVRFSLLGFVVQATSQLFECTKNVLAEYIMSGTGLKLDQFTYTLFMAPCALSILVLGVAATWEHEVIGSAYANMYYLIPNALCAFCLNLIIASVLKHCSAMGFILAGMVKDIVIVVVSSHIFGDIVSYQQYCGFVITLTGCIAWSAVKMYPHGFVTRSLYKICGLPIDEVNAERLSEQSPILTGKVV